MEKVLRNSILRRNQLAKKARRTDLKALQSEWREHNQYTNRAKNAMQNLIVSERKARREDWQLGPLAPNRDVGHKKGQFGTIPTILARGAGLPKRYRSGPRGKGSDDVGQEDKNYFPNGEWSGEGLPGNVVVGDRVAVVNGRPGVKGMIGEVFRVDVEAQEVAVRDVNKFDVEIPSYLMQDQNKLQTTEVSVKMKDIRLVIPLQSPDGSQRDYIVQNVYGAGPYKQRKVNSNLPRHTRYVSGHNMEIPWPTEISEAEHGSDVDTPLFNVESKSYAMDFESTSLFAGVIDELRGKYSRARKTHDQHDWIRQKVIVDARQQWLQQRVALVAPLSSRAKSLTRQAVRYRDSQWLKPERTMSLVKTARQEMVE